MTPPFRTRFELAVFDVAGTTVLDGDAVVTCLHEALAQRIPVSVQDAASVMGLPKPVAIRQLLAADGARRGEELDAAVDEAHNLFRSRLIERYGEPGSLIPADGAERLFAVLRQAGIRVALDTGFSRDILDTILVRLGWNGSATIDLSIASDEVPRGRPHPDIIHRAMALTDVGDAGLVAKVGDTPSDLLQGLSAGCGLVAGVTYGTHTRQQLERPGVEIVDRLADLLPLLGLGRARS